MALTVRHALALTLAGGLLVLAGVSWVDWPDDLRPHVLGVGLVAVLVLAGVVRLPRFRRVSDDGEDDREGG